MNSLGKLILGAVFLLALSFDAQAQIPVNTNFEVLSPQPIDTRDTLTTLADTINVQWTFPGLWSYVVDQDRFYYYNGIQWIDYATTISGAVDKTRLEEDSILVYYISEIEVGRDTLPTFTATNVGSGEGVYLQKVGREFQFKSIRTTNSNLTITSDANTVIINASYDYYTDDAAAASGGIAIGEVYKVDVANPYGLSWGTLKTRNQ